MFGSLMILILIVIILWTLVHKFLKLLNSTNTIKGPMPLPIIGSLHLLGKYNSPFEGFTALSKIYGNIYSIYLGSNQCIVVNSYPLMKEVLIQKGLEFGGRPNLLRYHTLFGGDRNNSLALCDWSALQETRRHIARIYCSPRLNSYNHHMMDEISQSETSYFLEIIQNKCTEVMDFKPIVMTACSNMFTRYMCSQRFSYECKEYQKLIQYYDEVFWDINQGYAVDFLPWLSPFYTKHMNKLTFWSSEIRKFIMDNVIEEHLHNMDYDEPPKDFTDALLQNLKTDPKLNWQHILFELEDFLGGHSAVGNLIILTLLFMIKFPHVKEKMEEEIESITKGVRNVTMLDKGQMVYTEATILETLRFISSPIVPHVATENTELDGHAIRKGTCIILNNYDLNKDPEYWENPLKFQPERFIKNGRIVRPSHFIPFGTGKRTCIGQQLVYGFSFVMVASITQYFDLNVLDKKHLDIKEACVALPPKLFPLIVKLKEKPKHITNYNNTNDVRIL